MFRPYQYVVQIILSTHFLPVQNASADISPLLPVMPPFRQRLFPRQHASEYTS